MITNFIQKGSWDREILRLAIPNILSNISLPLMASIDTALMGRLSASHVAAVGLGSILYSFLYWNCGFLRMGTTGMTAQYYGAGDDQEISATLFRALGLGLVLALLGMIIFPLFFNTIYGWFSVDATMQTHLYEYMKIRIWEMPAVIVTIAILGWYFGMQNALYPMIITIALNAINMGLSYYLVVHRGMEIRGVAIGTLVSNYVGLGLGIGFFLFRYKKYRDVGEMRDLFRGDKVSRFFAVNRDIALRTFLLTGSILFFFRQSAVYGTVVLAVQTVLWQFLNWVSYGIDGFAFAAESIVGKYKGANQDEDLLSVIKRVFLWALGLALLYSAIYYFLGPRIVALFSDQPDIIRLAKDNLHWIIIFPLISFASYVWDGVFVGLTATRSMLLSMSFAFVVYVLTFYIFKNSLGPDAIWVAFIVLSFCRGFIQTLLYMQSGVSLR